MVLSREAQQGFLKLDGPKHFNAVAAAGDLGGLIVCSKHTALEGYKEATGLLKQASECHDAHGEDGLRGTDMKARRDLELSLQKLQHGETGVKPVLILVVLMGIEGVGSDAHGGLFATRITIELV